MENKKYLISDHLSRHTLTSWITRSRLLIITLATLMITALVGCSTADVHLGHLDYPLVALHAAIARNLPGGIQEFSENGRVYRSAYFPTGNPGVIQHPVYSPKVKPFDPQRVLYRSYVKAAILGDSRPYVVTISVYNQDRTMGSNGIIVYRNVGHDERLAKVIAQKVMNDLVKSQDKRDLLDDFRVF